LGAVVGEDGVAGVGDCAGGGCAAGEERVDDGAEVECAGAGEVGAVRAAGDCGCDADRGEAARGAGEVGGGRGREIQAAGGRAGSAYDVCGAGAGEVADSDGCCGNVAFRYSPAAA